MRVPPPPTAGAVDRAVAATFAALDADSAPPPTSRLRAVDRPAPPPRAHLPAPAPPASAYAGGSGRAARSAKPWLAAAAAIVLVGLVTVGVLSNRGADQSSSDTAAASKSAQESAGDASSSGAGSAGSVEQHNGEGNASAAPSATSTAPPSSSEVPSDSALPPTSAPSGVTDLGAVTDATELADRLRSSVPLSASGGKDDNSSVLSDSEGSPFGDGSGSGCPGFGLAGDPARGEVVRIAEATFRGEPVRVHLYTAGDGQQRLVATDASCDDVVDVPYTP
jgi:hypothetical protein